MTAIRRFFLRLLNALRPSRAESELRREVSSHLALLEESFRSRGLSPEDARLAARRAFGNVELAKEMHRETRSLIHIDDLRSDLRYAARTLRASRGFSTVVVLTLALGIGAATAVFTFVNAIVLKPLGFPDNDRLVAVLPAVRGETIAVTPGDFLDWQAQNHSFADMAAFTVAPYSLTGRGEPAAVLAAVVSARFAETLGVTPVAGRTFASEAEADRNHTVMISNRLWRGHFQASPDIIGATITLDGAPYTVIGVMPEGFSFPRDLLVGSSRGSGARAVPDVDLWAPLAIRPGYRANAFLQVIGRLKPNVNIEQATANIATINASLETLYPTDRRNKNVSIVSLKNKIVRPVRPLLLTLFGAVMLLLTIACGNVAILLLARGTARERDAAIRIALGSGRRRLIQQRLAESVLLACLGGAGGVIVAIVAVRMLTTLVPPASLPRMTEIGVDGSVVAFSAVVSLIASIAFGILPVLQYCHSDVATALRRVNVTHTANSRYLSSLVSLQVALAFVLLFGAGLLFKSFQRLTNVAPGFKPDNILTLDLTLPDRSYSSLTEMRTFASETLQRLESAPGVVASGAVNLLPIGGPTLMGDFILEGVERPPGFIAVKPAISPGYFRTMGIPLLRGRDFEKTDTDHANGVAIVSESFARRAWTNQDAIGKRLKLGFGRPEQQSWLTVVGLVADIKQDSLALESKPAIYVPLLQAPQPFLLRNLTFAVRTANDPRAIESLVRERIAKLDPLLPIQRVSTMTQLLSDSVAAPRFRATLLGGFAGSALLLIAVGIFSVLGYSIARRTREIGVRMALGARHSSVSALVIKSAITMTTVGILFGMFLTLGVTRALQQFLFRMSPLDLQTYVLTAAVLCGLAVLASFIPARRAARVDPVIALRAE
jgi:putative ABC transport system permease protein